MRIAAIWILESRSRASACPETYQANTGSKNVRESIEYADGRIKPFCPSLIGTPGPIKPLELLLKDSDDGTGRVAGLELDGEWMCTQIVLCLFFVGVQGVIDY